MTSFYPTYLSDTDWIEREILHGNSDQPFSDFGLDLGQARADYLPGQKMNRLSIRSVSEIAMGDGARVHEMNRTDPLPKDHLL